MSCDFKDALCDAWMDEMPEDWDMLPQHYKDIIYKQFEEDFISGQYERAEMWSDR